MAELVDLEKLNSARLVLKAGLEKSKEVSSGLDKTGPRLREIGRRLSSLEGEFKPIVASRIDCHVGTVAAAALRVHATVRELGAVLSALDPRVDLFAHASALKRLEEALGFLSSSCELAGRWLESSSVACGGPSGLVLVLERLSGIERRARLEGGVVSDALDKIEREFSRLLVHDAALLDFDILKLQTMISRLKANSRVDKCASLFVEARVSAARRSLESLGLEYLDEKISDGDDTKSRIGRWGDHLEVAVKHVLGSERELCERVFGRDGSGGKDDLGIACFARIAVGSGILSLLWFGTKVADTKKDPIKLLRLLDVFRVMNGLRPDFSRVFGGPACSEIQEPTRDLVRRLVEGACGIFRELPEQVAVQRRFSSPPDGSVPRLVRFVTQYCDELLGDYYRPALTEVLTIQKTWKREALEESDVAGHLRIVMKEIGTNLDEWSKAYEDVSLSYLFMMNNHCHFSNLKGTKLGDAMGGAWLSGHAQYRDYYAGLYLARSWGNILPFLGRKGAVVIGAEEEKRLKAFDRALEEKYERQSKWAIPDKMLRQSVRDLVVQTVVPAYRRYVVETRGALAEKDAQRLESKLGSLFEADIVKFSNNNNNKHGRFVGRIKNVVANKFFLTRSLSLSSR